MIDFEVRVAVQEWCVSPCSQKERTVVADNHFVHDIIINTYKYSPYPIIICKYVLIQRIVRCSFKTQDYSRCRSHLEQHFAMLFLNTWRLSWCTATKESYGLEQKARGYLTIPFSGGYQSFVKL